MSKVCMMVSGAVAKLAVASRTMAAHLREIGREDDAQGTTEYAILVGVLVVIAIIAIIAFKDKVSELWTDISDGINKL